MRPEASPPFREPPRPVPLPRGGVLGWRGPPLGFVTRVVPGPPPCGIEAGDREGAQREQSGEWAGGWAGGWARGVLKNGKGVGGCPWGLEVRVQAQGV